MIGMHGEDFQKLLNDTLWTGKWLAIVCVTGAFVIGLTVGFLLGLMM